MLRDFLASRDRNGRICLLIALGGGLGIDRRELAGRRYTAEGHVDRAGLQHIFRQHILVEGQRHAAAVRLGGKARDSRGNGGNKADVHVGMLRRHVEFLTLGEEVAVLFKDNLPLAHEHIPAVVTVFMRQHRVGGLVVGFGIPLDPFAALAALVIDGRGHALHGLIGDCLEDIARRVNKRTEAAGRRGFPVVLVFVLVVIVVVVVAGAGVAGGILIENIIQLVEAIIQVSQTAAQRYMPPCAGVGFVGTDLRNRVDHHIAGTLTDCHLLIPFRSVTLRGCGAGIVDDLVVLAVIRVVLVVVDELGDVHTLGNYFARAGNVSLGTLGFHRRMSDGLMPAVILLPEPIRRNGVRSGNAGIKQVDIAVEVQNHLSVLIELDFIAHLLLPAVHQRGERLI